MALGRRQAHLQMLLTLAVIVLLLNLLSYWASASLGREAASQLEKLFPVECGIEPFGNTVKFEILFYLVGLLYLIFDLEIVLLFPLAVAATSLYLLLSPLAFLFVLLFLLLLTLALVGGEGVPPRDAPAHRQPHQPRSRVHLGALNIQPSCRPSSR